MDMYNNVNTIIESLNYTIKSLIIDQLGIIDQGGQFLIFSVLNNRSGWAKFVLISPGKKKNYNSFS